MKLHLPIFLRKAILALMLVYGVPALHAANLTLGAEDSLSVDYSASGSLLDLNNGTLRLSGGTTLQLSSCGEGDGKTYILLSGVSELLDAQGNVISLDSTNNAASLYFDATQPGSGFWVDAKLQLVDGNLQLVLHNKTVKAAQMITTSQYNPSDYQYYDGLIFKNSSSSSLDGAIYGYGDITLSNNGSVVFERNAIIVSSGGAFGGAISGSSITLSNNGSVEFIGNSASSSARLSGSFHGGAIYGSSITLCNNGSVEFSGNRVRSSSSYIRENSFCGGAMCGSTIALSNNGSIVFSDNSAQGVTSIACGGAIYGGDSATIMLSNNGNVTFNGNWARSASSYGGAIYGGNASTITLSNNGSVSFSRNTAESGGAIFGDVTMASNGRVIFSRNSASEDGGAIRGGSITLNGNAGVSFCGNSIAVDSSYGSGGAIYGYEDISLCNNGSVKFSGNSVLSKDDDACGGAIYGAYSGITLSNNGSVIFCGNTAYAYGGAIYSHGEGCLSIRNNDSVEFYQNAEVSDDTYRLRSIYVFSYDGDEISLSAAEGKNIIFRDSIYIGSSNTFKLNEAYEGTEQQGDIIFTGATTEDDLYTVKGNVTGTVEEIRLSRTTEVNSLTELHGGRLRVEEGAVYQGCGITAMAGSAATVRVQNATLSQTGYDLTFNAGTTLELAGQNSITGTVQMLGSSNLVFDFSKSQDVTTVYGDLNLSGALSVSSLGYTCGENIILLYVRDGISGWEEYAASSDGESYTLMYGDLLVQNYNADTFLPYFRGENVITSTQSGVSLLNYYDKVQATGMDYRVIDGDRIDLKYNDGVVFCENTCFASGGVIGGGAITVHGNGRVLFSGNQVTGNNESGGAVCGWAILMSNNGSVEFCGNSASVGGAIYGYEDISLTDNGSVKFSGNNASYGGAISLLYVYGGVKAKLQLSNNGSVVFNENTASSDGGAIDGYGDISFNNIVIFNKNYASTFGGAIYGEGDISLSDNCSVCFSGNVSTCGGAIYERGNIALIDNDSVEFNGNKTSSLGGAIFGRGNITLCDNGSVEFGGNISLGAIYGDWNSTIILSNNGSVIFSGNTAEAPSFSSYAGAIHTEGTLSIRNNDSVEFYQNAEVRNGPYRLRCIYADGYGDVSLSAAAGKSITFRDSIYIGEGSSFKLNEAYEGKAQQGDIIFTGATTVDDLYTVKGNVAGTMEEIRLSRTTEVKTLTELYGGRLRIEAGAIYKGSGMTIVENSGASVWLRNAQMLHQGHNISFGKGTTFGLRGCNVSQSDNLFLEEGSSLSFDIAGDNVSTVVLTHTGALTLGGSVTLNIGTADSSLAHGLYKLLQVTDLSSLENWSNENLKMGDGSYTISDIEWVDNTLCFNYSGQQLSSLPILPEIPEPEIPDTPVTPDDPEIPDAPVTPDEPEIPDTPVPPDEPEIPDTPVTPEEPEIPEPLKPFRPGDSALVSGEIDKTMEVILNSKGSLTLEGKVNAGAITVENDKNLTFKSNKKKPGSLAGDGDLTKKGKGTLTLNDGNGNWTGDIYLKDGTIKVQGATSLGKGDVYLQGGTLNLGSKVIANDIVQEKSAAIKSGKKFTGTYTLESGELQKGSTLNINRKATLAGGTVNGTLSGNGTTTVTGKVKLGDKGKITTKALTLGADATLTTSAKGLSSKTSTLTIGEDATLSLGGKMTVDSVKMNGGTLKTTASKPAAITVKNNMELTDAVLTTNGKVTTNRLTLNDSTMSIKGAKAQNLTVKQNLTIGSGSALTLNGKLSAGSLTIKKDGMLTMTGSKPVTLKVKGALTLNEGSSIILNYSFAQGKTYKVLTFGSYSGSKDYYSIFGVEADDCTITNTGKALTLTVNTKWKPQTQQKAVGAGAATEPVVATKPQANPVADALVQANWSQLEASRAFVNAMANRSMAVQLGNGERAVWASAIGSSSRHDTAGGHNGADTNVSGGAFGLETQVGRASLFGLSLGNSWTRVSAHGFGTIEQDTTHLGVYGQTNWRSGISADWSAAYGRSESESMGSDWNQKHLQLDGRVSYNHELNARTVLSPFAGVQYYASDSAALGTTDTGSLQNLRAEIGVGASHRIGKLGVFGEIALHQDLARNTPTVSMEGVRYTGMNPGRTGINFTIGASYELSDKWSVNASYTGEFVKNANAHSANIGASYKF